VDVRKEVFAKKITTLMNMIF